MKESDIFRGEHPDTRSGSQWWAIVQKKRGIVINKPTKICRICGTPFIGRQVNQVACSRVCITINRRNNTEKWLKAKAIV
jgi:hypothetical protein